MCSRSVTLPRYLPRIKAVADAFEQVKGMISSGKWTQLEAFANTEADNAALPLKVRRVLDQAVRASQG